MWFALTLAKLEPETCFSLFFFGFFFLICMGNLCFPKRQRIRLPAFVCLFVEDTFDFRAKWNHKSENCKHKTETREESEKKLKITITIDSASRPYYLILISHLFHTTRHRHLVDDFTARLEGPMYQGAPPPALARQTHPMHNATSASDGSPPPSSVISLWSSVFGLLSSVWPACQLAITMRVRKCCDIETTDNATGTTRCYPLGPFTPIGVTLSPAPATGHCPLAVGSSKVWLQWKHA